jgi:hypothetical protein
MMRHKFTIGIAVFTLTLGAGQGFAQERGGQGRPGGGGERTGGTAQPRGGGESRGGGGGSEARGGGSSGGGMSGGSSVGSSSSPSAPSSSGSSVGERPTRSADRAPRRSDDQGTRGRAMPRSGSSTASANGGSVSREANGNGGSSAGESAERAVARGAVPVYSRPRDGRPVTGQAHDRGVYVNPQDVYYIYRPYYYPYGFWGAGLGYGLGYAYYDPFWYGGYGYGHPYGGYGGYYGGGSYYGGGGYSSGGGYSTSYRDAGSLRLKIKPREGQVFVDGYFVGEVDSFDGTFQKLTLDGGGHRVEIKAEGYEPLQFEVLITPGETVTYRGEMTRIK